MALCCSQNSIAQSVVDDLPKTWEMQMGNSIHRVTLHRDGRLTSETIFGCFNCGGYGMCQVCKGTGGQYWYQLGMLPCGACGGSGGCRGCGGKGYTVQNSTTQYGVTVVYDEKGRMYIMGGPGNSSDSGHSCNKRQKIDKIEYIANFGLYDDVYCPKCQRTDSRHIHVLK